MLSVNGRFATAAWISVISFVRNLRVKMRYCLDIVVRTALKVGEW